jgi:beta-lactamase class A
VTSPPPPSAPPAGVPARPCESPHSLSKKNRVLQRNLESALAAARLTRHTNRHRLAVAVVDLTRAGETYYAGVNDDDMLYAASLPKIAILLADAQAAADGRLTWTSEHDRRLSAMITESSNGDASWGAELVGFGGIEAVVRDPRYCFYDNVHGGLWLGRLYAPASEIYPDPLHDIVHGATARQAARFYTMLERRELVSKDWSDHLLALMGPPKHHHKFVAGLANRTNVTFVARKSGTWMAWHADSALIQHDDARYVAVALSENVRKGEDVMQQVIRILDDLVTAGKHRRPQTPPRA